MIAANQCQLNYKMSDKEIKVPNIGEFKDVEVIEVLVSNGQSVSKNDPLITIESDKSSVEIPASFNGKVKSVKIKVGDRVSEGDLILTVEQSGEEEKSIEQKTIKEEEPAANQDQVEKVVKVNQAQNLIKKNNSETSSASPKVRKFARELGVNINEIVGSERQGRIVEDDVKNLYPLKLIKLQIRLKLNQKKLLVNFPTLILEKLKLKICLGLKN